MHIAFVASIKFPTNKAHGFQIARTISEWRSLGHDVVLYAAIDTPSITKSPKDYYDLSDDIPVVYTQSRNILKWRILPQRISFLVREWLHVRSVAQFLKEKKGEVVIYTRDALAVPFFKKKGFTVIFNAHGWSSRQAKTIKYADGVVCNSIGTQEAIIEAFPDMPTVVVHNATDPNPYVESEVSVLREKLSLPQNTKIAVYMGHLYGWKGASVLAEAARKLPAGWQIVCVGGTKEDVLHWQEETKEYRESIVFLGHKPKELVPHYLAAADVMVLPNVPTTTESVTYTSPIKLFEYLASGRPTVASDLPSVRNIASDREVYFFEPGNVEEFVRTLLVAEKDEKKKAKAALVLSKKYTWRAQVGVAVEFFEKVKKSSP